MNNVSKHDAFIKRHKWTFAKTMPESPHEWLNSKVLPPNEQAIFDEFVAFIRANGSQCRFWGRMYTYYFHDGWFYWTMGAPISETYILNRASEKTNQIINGEMVIMSERKTN